MSNEGKVERYRWNHNPTKIVEAWSSTVSFYPAEEMPVRMVRWESGYVATYSPHLFEQCFTCIDDDQDERCATGGGVMDDAERRARLIIAALVQGAVPIPLVDVIKSVGALPGIGDDAARSGAWGLIDRGIVALTPDRRIAAKSERGAVRSQ